MTGLESVFLQLLGESLFGQAPSELKSGCEAEILRLACLHNVPGIVWSALKRRGGSDKVLGGFKRVVLVQTVLQTRKTQEFLRFYSMLSESGIHAVCVKGITLRYLYPEPDLRPSSDEDLIIREDEMPLFAGICERCGFEIREQSRNQLTVLNPESGLLIEAQTTFFLPDGALSERMNALFSQSLQKTEEAEIQGVSIRELSPDDHLLYLICHILKHYIRSGFGIRQICDILLFCEKNDGRIDYAAVFSRLSRISADGFAADIFRIGEKYFGFSRVPGALLAGRQVDFEALLDDVLAAGVFGKSSQARTHSAPLTLAAVRGENRIGQSAAKRVFISFEELRSLYPQIKNRKWLYPYYTGLRFLTYLKKTRGVKSTGQSVKLASQRIRQIEAYGLLAKEPGRAYDDLVISAIKNRMASGKTARLEVTGSSMVPFLVPGRDRVDLAPVEQAPAVGDVVLYQRENGAYVLHRVIKKSDGGFYFAGDRQSRLEGPIKQEQMIAVCVSFERKGKTLSGRERRWRIYNLAWRLLIKQRGLILGAYERIKKNK